MKNGKRRDRGKQRERDRGGGGGGGGIQREITEECDKNLQRMSE